MDFIKIKVFLSIPRIGIWLCITLWLKRSYDTSHPFLFSFFLFLSFPHSFILPFCFSEDYLEISLLNPSQDTLAKTWPNTHFQYVKWSDADRHKRGLGMFYHGPWKGIILAELYIGKLLIQMRTPARTTGK